MAADYTLSVLKERADGGRDLDLKFTAFKMKSVEGDRQRMNFDSTQHTAPDAGNPVAAMLRKLIGRHVRLQLDAGGKVTGVEGVDELAAQVVGNSPSPASTCSTGCSVKTVSSSLACMPRPCPTTP